MKTRGKFLAYQTTAISDYVEILLRKMIRFSRIHFKTFQTSSRLHIVRRKLVRNVSTLPTIIHPERGEIPIINHLSASDQNQPRTVAYSGKTI